MSILYTVYFILPDLFVVVLVGVWDKRSSYYYQKREKQHKIKSVDRHCYLLWPQKQILSLFHGIASEATDRVDKKSNIFCLLQSISVQIIWAKNG